jgi:TonB-linked SusC/RagA family outer membrane protein
MTTVRATVLSVVLVLFGAVALAAQGTGTVTGQVVDASTGAPLTGVQMQVAGTNIGGLTDQSGRYLLTRVPAGEQTLRAVLIGYALATQSVAVTAGGTVNANFELRTSAVPLDAIVVSAATGREQRARELGTSVSSIEVEDLNPAPVTSFSDVLGGRTEGLILQDVSGTTGTSQRIRIRGANSVSLSNEPLIYVDGVRLDDDITSPIYTGGQDISRLNDINPNDIANIEVVKGPAASAMYGTAGANGVILITTKRGRPGSTQWNAFVETGSIDDITDWPANFMAFQRNPAAPSDFRDNGLFYSQSSSRPDGHVICPNWAAALGSCEQTDMLSFNTLTDDRTTPFQTGLRNRYGASVRGGTEQVRFFVSGQFENEEGVHHYNDQSKTNFRANLDAELSETVDLSVSFGYTDANLSLNSNDNSIFSPIINGLTGKPYYVPPDTTRRYGAPVNDLNYGWGFNQDELEELPSHNEVDRYITSANLRWRPTSWLTVNATGGLDLTSSHDFQTLQPNTLPIAASYAAGYRQSQRSEDYVYTGQTSAVATFEIMSDLLSTTTVGGSYNKDNAVSTYCYGSALVPGTSSCATVSNLLTVDEGFFEIRTIGAYVQQQLAWRDRLFVDFGIRGDDDSAFGQEFGLAYYPSAAVSWVVAEEPWFPELDFLSTLRLRGAWGVSGLRPGFRDAITLYEPTTVATRSGDMPGVSLDVTGNLLLEPERTTELELGFETGFWSDRISVDFTYYDKTSEDALVSKPLPASLGLTGSVFDNLGSITNKGTELGVDLMVFETQDFAFNLGFTNTSLSNEIEELGLEEPITFDPQRHVEGYSAGGFWAYPLDYTDEDGDGLIGPSEIAVGDSLQYIGPSLPKWQRSFFADFRVFDFLTVSTLIEGRGGHYIENFSEAFRCTRNSHTFGCAATGDPDASDAAMAAYLGRWWGDPDTGRTTNDGYVEPADFYKWREVSVTLSTPNAWAQRFDRLSGLRLTVAGRNLATWTDYTGIDPEVVSPGASANFSAYEFNTQPPVRYLMLRLDYTF